MSPLTTRPRTYPRFGLSPTNPYDPQVANTPDPPGCRNAAIATTLLLSLAIAFMGIGLSLTNSGDCTGSCETTALTLLYAGGPIGAAMGVVFEGVFVVWPLEITLWVVIGFLLARRADRTGNGVLRPTLIVVTLALGYGLVLSNFVEIAV